jgi:hypothetical protein
MGIALALLCAAVGWEGTLKTQGTPFDGPPDEGVKASGSGWNLRFDIRRQDSVITFLFDLARGELVRYSSPGGDYATLPIEAGKTTLIGGNPPAKCGKQGLSSCLRKSGFRRKGRSTVNGHAATQWERTVDWPQDYLQALWVADDFTELVPLRQVTRWLGHTVTIDVLNLKVAPQPAADFAPPSGYKKFEKPPAMN